MERSRALTSAPSPIKARAAAIFPPFEAAPAKKKVKDDPCFR